jgi:thiol-disulfide isomerase/thioredoxin
VRFKSLSVIVGSLAVVVLTLSVVLSASRVDATTSGPPIKGSMIKFVASDPPVPVPDTPFIGVDGETIKLADYKGRLVLLNFWATWCAPCIRELPSIESLSISIQDDNFMVQLVSIDRGGAKIHAPFLKKLGIGTLGSASDPRAALLRALKGPGIPITLLIDRDGMVIGRLIGDAQWDSPEAKALIRYYLDRE